MIRHDSLTVSPQPRLRFLVFVASAIGLACAVLSIQAASAAQTKTYVMSWLVPAMYSKDGDCAALEPLADPGRSPIDSMYLRILTRNLGKTQQEAEELMKGFSPGYPDPPVAQLLINRGRVNGRPVNVYQNPESYPDPQINTVIGKHAIGFNLDGKGADDPSSFQDPYTHEKGVDNQFFRVTGCIRSSRKIAPEQPAHWIDVWLPHSDTSPAWLVSVTGEDLSKDGPVTVSFDTAIERTRLDAQGQARRDMTFRIDPNPATHVVLRGEIRNGVLELIPGDLKLAVRSIVTPFDLTNAHMRLRMKEDGSMEGFLGGYQTWKPIFFSFYGFNAYNTEGHYGIDMPGVYYGMKKLADADPDPSTGENRRISITYAIQLVPAFAVKGERTILTEAKREPAPVKVSAFTPATAAEPPSPGGAPIARRLSPEQYKRIVADVFGLDVSGRFEPEVRVGPVGGLAAVGASRVSISATGFEQYDNISRSIAASVVSEKYRKLLIPCQPASPVEWDDDCARAFLTEAGRYLYRRPLASEELDAFLAAGEASAKKLGSFYAGAAMSLSAILQSLPFLFRDEAIEPHPGKPGEYRLDAYSKASRLSFLLWDTAPDKELLRAAESGEIHSGAGLAKQVDRLLASPRVEDGLRAFFRDMLDLDHLSEVSKDSVIYPKYSAEVPRDALEQTLRTIVHHTLSERGDYRDLFTTRKTFLTPLLSSVYGVPLKTNAPLGQETGVWEPYEYPQGDPRAGILTHITFLSLHSHPGRTSPTLRGKALREILFCEKVPDPPPNVNVNLAETGHGFKTTREKLAAHSREPMCAGCHKITDPIGLALEHFDSAGGFRLLENGQPIDASGAFGGKKFGGAPGLGQAVHDYPGTTSCLVEKLYSYGAGRTPEKGEEKWMAYLKQSFADVGYRIPDLLRVLATSEGFYRVTPPQLRAEKNTATKLVLERRP